MDPDNVDALMGLYRGMVETDATGFAREFNERTRSVSSNLDLVFIMTGAMVDYYAVQQRHARALQCSALMGSVAAVRSAYNRAVRMFMNDAGIRKAGKE